MAPSDPAGASARMLAWRRTDVPHGLAVARVEEVAGGCSFEATELLAGHTEPLACTLRVVVGADWLTREVVVSRTSSQGIDRVDLRADPARRWWVDGEPRPELDGCLDVDVAATPLTNTFPIRRLGRLGPGEAATFPVAWVDVPGLEVTRVHQTYRRIDALTWTYQARGGREYELTVDPDGLVVNYEGFATRVPVAPDPSPDVSPSPGPGPRTGERPGTG